MNWKDKLKSRKFLLALSGAVLVVLNEGIGLGINAEAYAYIAGFIITYIAGETAVDVARSNKQ